MELLLANKTFVVTGATSGIGLAAAEILAEQGASVIGVGRSKARCAGAERRLRRRFPDARITYLVGDLSLQSEVRLLAGAIREAVRSSGSSSLDGLINNAGTFTYWFVQTAEGFEMQWAVNHLAPFLLTHELLPLLQAAPTGRVVTVSSGSHYHTRLNWGDIQLRRSYSGLLAYQQTKLANMLFTVELNRRLGPDATVRAFAADPGLVKTDIGLKGNPPLAQWVWERRRSGGISARESAQGVVFLATDPAIQDAVDVYWKHSHPQVPSKEALDEESAGRLWKLSAQMCGLPDLLIEIEPKELHPEMIA